MGRKGSSSGKVHRSMSGQVQLGSWAVAVSNGRTGQWAGSRAVQSDQTFFSEFPSLLNKKERDLRCAR